MIQAVLSRRPAESSKVPTRCLAALVTSAMCMVGQDYQSLFREAADLTRQQRFSEAIGRYEAALQLQPSAPEALSNLAVLLYTTSQYSRAETMAVRALKGQPGLLPAQIVMGLSRVQLKQYQSAIPPLEAALATAPDHRDALLGLASARIGAGNPEGSLELYNRQIANMPKDVQAWYGYAIANEKLAERSSRQLASTPGTESWYHRLLAEYWVDRGHLRLAREAADEVRRLNPDQPGLDALDEAIRASRPVPRAPVRLETDGPAARMYEQARSSADAARRGFEKIVELAPESWQSQLFLGDVARQQRKFQDAIRHYERAAALQPDTPAAMLGLGTVYWELADDERAARSLEAVVERAPDNWLALFALGNIAVKQRDDSRAIALLERCVTLAPNNLGIRADLGKVYLHQGQHAKAVEHLEMARPIDVYGDIHYQLAQALRKEGRSDQAAAMLSESSRIRATQLKKEQRLKRLP